MRLRWTAHALERYAQRISPRFKTEALERLETVKVPERLYPYFRPHPGSVLLWAPACEALLILRGPSVVTCVRPRPGHVRLLNRLSS